MAAARPRYEHDEEEGHVSDATGENLVLRRVGSRSAQLTICVHRVRMPVGGGLAAWTVARGMWLGGVM